MHISEQELSRIRSLLSGSECAYLWLPWEDDIIDGDLGCLLSVCLLSLPYGSDDFCDLA